MKSGFIALVLMMVMSGSWACAENLHPFSSDGCSGSPDSIVGLSFVHCCVAHDLEYWVGGTKIQKNQADENLKQCIQRTIPSLKVVGTVYKLVVIVGGAPSFLGTINSPFTWRWGYGWEEDHGYSPSTRQELELALEDLQRMEADLDAHERAINETRGFAWRFGNLKISHAQFKQIRNDLQKKINSILSVLKDSELSFHSEEARVGFSS